MFPEPTFMTLRVDAKIDSARTAREQTDIGPQLTDPSRGPADEPHRMEANVGLFSG